MITADAGAVEIQGAGGLLINGSVGLGTSSPDEKLHVEGDGLFDLYGQGDGAGLFFREGFTSTNSYNLGVLVHDDGDGSPDALDVAAFDGIYFNTGSNARNPRMAVQSDGRVLINNLAEVSGAVVTSNGSGVLGKTPLTGDANDVLLGTGAFGPGSAFEDHDWYGVGTTDAPTNISDNIFTNGNVGIGITTPSNRLTIGGSNAETFPALGLRSGNNNSGFNNGAQIAFGYNGTNQYQHFIQTRHNSGNAQNAIDFYVSDGTQFNTLTSGSVHAMSLVSGNVGIGTTTPAQKLEVSGSTRITSLAGTGNRLVYANNIGDLVASSPAINTSQMVDGAGAANRVSFWADANSLTSSGEFLYSSTGNLSVFNAESSTGEVRLGAAWNRPGVYSSTDLQLFAGTASNNLIFGNNNNELLRISTTGILRFDDTKNTYAGVEWYYGDNDRYGLAQAPGGNTALYTAANYGPSFISFNLASGGSSFSELARFTHSGNLGIGNAAPDRKLYVSGNIYASTTLEAAANGSWYLRGGDDHELRDVNISNTMGVWGRQNPDRAGIQLGSDGSYIFGDNGNIGIGYTTPAHKLHIDGDMKIGVNTSTLRTIYFGDASFVYIQETADDYLTVEAANGTRIGNQGAYTRDVFHGTFTVGNNNGDQCSVCVWRGWSGNELEIQVPWSALGIPDGTNKTVMLMADGNNNSYNDTWNVALQSMFSNRMDILIDRTNGGGWGLTTLRIHYIIMNNN